MQHLGLLSICLLILVGLALARRHGFRTSTTLSSNIARIGGRSMLLYSICMSIVTVLFYAFLFGWFGRHVAAGPVFYVASTIGFMLQTVIIWVPKTQKHIDVHSIAGYSLVLPMLVLAYVVATASTLSSWVGSIAGVYLWIPPIVALMLLLLPVTRHHMLAWQAVLYVGFWIVIVSATYG